MLKCPNCKSIQLHTTDSRNKNEDDEYLYRRRKCGDCGYRFTTIEIDKDTYDELLKKKMHLRALSIALSQCPAAEKKSITEMAHKALLQMQVNASSPPQKKPSSKR